MLIKRFYQEHKKWILRTPLIVMATVVYLFIGVLVMRWVHAETLGSVMLDSDHAWRVGRHTFWVRDTSEMYHRNWAAFGVITWPIWLVTKTVSVIFQVVIWLTTALGKATGE